MTAGGPGGREERDAPPALVEPPSPGEPPALVEPPAPGEPATTQPTAVDPPRTEPTDTEPADPEPADTEPPGTEPPRTEPTASAPPHGIDAGHPATLGIDSWLDAPPGMFPGLTEPSDDDLDRAFAPEAFREYDDDVLPAEPVPEPAAVSPFGMPPDDAPAASDPLVPASRVQILIGVCIAVIVLVALIASFAGGRAAARVDDPMDASASPGPTASATPVPRIPLALAAPGVQPWDRLGGGECLQTFAGAWADTFTVVDCGQQHTAQLILRAKFADAANAAYPGATALQQRMAALCTAPSVVDLSRAADVSDLQVSSSYAATRRQWEGGDRDYFCFVSRQSGAPIDGSVAGTAQKAVWATRAPAPSPTETSKPAP